MKPRRPRAGRVLPPCTTLDHLGDVVGDGGEVVHLGALVAEGHLGGGVAGDGLYSPQVAAGEPVGPGQAGDAGAVEDVAAVADQEVADALGFVALGFAGLPTPAARAIAAGPLAPPRR